MDSNSLQPIQNFPAGASKQSLLRRLEAERINSSHFSAWPNFRPTLEKIIQSLPARDVLEIGGGRQPFFLAHEAERLGFRLTVNDIDESELHTALVQNGITFDIAGKKDNLLDYSEKFDLIFSRMVFEHIKEPSQAWSNIYSMLKPGGIGFAFVPTLYSPPFVINKIVPDVLTSRILRLLDPERNPTGVPKFPAYYYACRASETALKPFLVDAGFKEVCVIPFYGTPYFAGIPLLRWFTMIFDYIVQYFDVRALASYAYIIAMK